MSTSSPPTSEMARKNLRVALRGISSVGQNTIAREIGISETTLSNFCTKEIREDSVHAHLLERACAVLAAAGVKCVPVGYECYPKDKMAAIFTLAQHSLGSMKTVDQLMWEE